MIVVTKESNQLEGVEFDLLRVGETFKIRIAEPTVYMKIQDSYTVNNVVRVFCEGVNLQEGVLEKINTSVRVYPVTLKSELILQEG